MKIKAPVAESFTELVDRKTALQNLFMLLRNFRNYVSKECFLF